MKNNIKHEWIRIGSIGLTMECKRCDGIFYLIQDGYILSSNFAPENGCLSDTEILIKKILE